MSFHRIKIERSIDLHPFSAMFICAHIFHKVRRKKHEMKKKHATNKNKRCSFSLISWAFFPWHDSQTCSYTHKYIKQRAISNRICQIWISRRTSYSQNNIPANIRRSHIPSNRACVVCFSSSSSVRVWMCCFFRCVFLLLIYVRKVCGSLMFVEENHIRYENRRFSVRNGLLSFNVCFNHLCKWRSNGFERSDMFTQWNVRSFDSSDRLTYRELHRKWVSDDYNPICWSEKCESFSSRGMFDVACLLACFNHGKNVDEQNSKTRTRMRRTKESEMREKCL